MKTNMSLIRTLALTTLLANSHSTAWATVEVNEKALPQGMSKIEALKKLKIYETKMSEIKNQDDAELINFRRSIDLTMQPDLDRLQKILALNLNLKQEHEAYQVGLKKIIESNLDPLAKHRELSALAEKQKPIFEKWLNLAQVSISAVSKRIEGIVQSFAFKTGRRYEFSNDGFMSFRWRFTKKQKPFPPSPIEITLQAPFAFKQSDHGGQGSETVDLDSGRFSTFAAGLFIAGHTNRAGLGHFVEVPTGGYRHGRLVAALPETSFAMTAFSDILGATGASAETTVDVFANNQSVCRERFDHGWVLAPLLWYTQTSGTDTYNITCDFDVPAAGTEIVIHFEAAASVWAVVLGGSNSSVRAKPRDIKVEFRP